MKLKPLVIKNDIEKVANSLGIDIVIEILENSFRLNSIVRGKNSISGNGAKLLAFIKELSDKYDKPIELDVDDRNDKQHNLVEYYKKQGFKLTKYYELVDNKYELKDNYNPSKMFYPMMTYTNRS